MLPCHLTVPWHCKCLNCSRNRGKSGQEGVLGLSCDTFEPLIDILSKRYIYCIPTSLLQLIFLNNNKLFKRDLILTSIPCYVVNTYVKNHFQ